MSLRHTLAIAAVAAAGMAGTASAHHTNGYTTYVLKPTILRPIVKPQYKVFRPCPVGWVYVGSPLNPQFHCQPGSFLWGR